MLMSLCVYLILCRVRPAPKFGKADRGAITTRYCEQAEADRGPNPSGHVVIAWELPTPQPTEPAQVCGYHMASRD